MASVADLLLAAQAQKSPFISFLEGATKGIGEAQSGSLDRVTKLIQLDEMRMAQEHQARIREQQRQEEKVQIAKQAEQSVQAGLRGVSKPMPLTPQQKIEVSYSEGPQGITRSSKITTGDTGVKSMDALLTEKVRAGEMTLEEAMKKKAEGGMGGAYLPTPAESGEGADAMAKGDIQLSKISGRGKQSLMILNAYEKKYPKEKGYLSPMELENMAKAQTARVAALNGTAVIKQQTAVDQYLSATEQALELSKGIPRTGVPLANAAKRKTVMQTMGKSDLAQKYATLNALILEAAMQGGQVFTGNELTDIRFRSEMQRLNVDMPHEQMEKVLNALRQIALVRKNALLNSNVQYLPGQEPPGKQSPATSSSEGLTSDLGTLSDEDLLQQLNQ